MNYKLFRRSIRPGVYEDIKEAPYIENNKIDIYKLKQDKEILKYIKIILENNKPEYNKILYKNLPTLKSFITKEDFKKAGLDYNEGNLIKAYGTYSISTNTIKLYTSCSKTEIHELLHMSSSMINKNISYSGFSQTVYFSNKLFKSKLINKHIGRGLNEGYTNMLALRYMYLLGYEKDSFPLEKLAYIMEYIIGEEEMKKLYFSVDLKSLIDKLSIYDSSENIIKLLVRMDKLYKTKDEDEFYKIKDILLGYYEKKVLDGNNCNIGKIEEIIKINNKCLGKKYRR